MKNIVLLISLVLIMSCKTQKTAVNTFSREVTVQDISKQNDLNYYFSRIDLKNSITKSLFKGDVHLNIFALSDPKSTSNKSIAEETETFSSSYFVSISPDGDYYTKSKLYKIEGLYSPKVIEIYEGSFPYFFIKIAHGDFKERKIESFKFQGIE